jgi:hypothetical protein
MADLQSYKTSKADAALIRSSQISTSTNSNEAATTEVQDVQKLVVSPSSESPRINEIVLEDSVSRKRTFQVFNVIISIKSTTTLTRQITIYSKCNHHPHLHHPHHLFSSHQLNPHFPPTPSSPKRNSTSWRSISKTSTTSTSPRDSKRRARLRP